MAEVGIEDARASERLIDRDIKYSASSTLPFYGSSVLYDVLNSSFFFFFFNQRAKSRATRCSEVGSLATSNEYVYDVGSRCSAQEMGQRGRGKEGQRPVHPFRIYSSALDFRGCRLETVCRTVLEFENLE